MKILDYINQLRTFYSNGLISDDSFLTAGMAYQILNTVRETLIGQTLKKGGEITDSFYSYLCKNFVEGSFNGCSEVTVLKDIPNVIFDSYKPLIKVYIKGQSIPYVMPDVFPKKGLFYSQKYSFTYTNNTIYIKYPFVKSEDIMVMAVVSDILNPAVCDFNICDNALNMEYPVGEELTNIIIENARKEISRLFYLDTTNDTNEKKDKS